MTESQSPCSPTALLRGNTTDTLIAHGPDQPPRFRKLKRERVWLAGLLPFVQLQCDWSARFRRSLGTRLRRFKELELELDSLVPSLSARQIFIAYSMKNRRGKSGSKRHDDACRIVTEASHVVYFIFVNVIVRLRHECQRVCKQRAKDTRTKALN